MPSDLTLPFARFVSRTKLGITKRFTFGQVYRQNIVGGQPRTLHESAFDIVHSVENQVVAEVEVLKIVQEIYDELTPLLQSKLRIEISHYDILEGYLAHFQIKNQLRNQIMQILSQVLIIL